MGIIAIVPIAKLAVHIDGLVGGGDDPFNGHVSSFGDLARAVLVQAVGGTAVHPQLQRIHFPIEDNLVGGVGETKVGGIGLGDNGDFDWRFIPSLNPGWV